MTGNKKASMITSDDVLGTACILLSVFIRDPQFQGQTKDKLTNSYVTRLVDNAVKDRFDHWLTSDTSSANRLLDYAIERAELRTRRRKNRYCSRRKTPCARASCACR